MDAATHLAVQLRSQPWAMSSGALQALVAAAEANRLPAAARRRTAAAVNPSSAGVCVIPVRGYLSQHANLLTYLGMGVSTDGITQRLTFASQMDDTVDSIVLDISCQGGEVYGMTELSAAIRDARQIKPVVAVANSVATGAGYWIASACSSVFVTPGGEVGGVGMSVAHEDASAALAKAGINTTLISAGKYKVEGHPFGPLDSEARGAMQSSVDRYYGLMVNDIARGRGTTVDKVRSDFGGGRGLGAKAAKQAGMVDGVASFDDVLSDITRGKTGKRTGAGASSLALAQIALATAMRN